MSLVIWTICGIFTMFGAYCYAELGCMIKKSGADYAYIHVTLGPLAAFIRLWIECIIVRPCTGAIQSLTFALYIIKPLFPDCTPPESASRLLAASKFSYNNILTVDHQFSPSSNIQNGKFLFLVRVGDQQVHWGSRKLTQAALFIKKRGDGSSMLLLSSCCAAYSPSVWKILLLVGCKYFQKNLNYAPPKSVEPNSG